MRGFRKISTIGGLHLHRQSTLIFLATVILLLTSCNSNGSSSVPDVEGATEANSQSASEDPASRQSLVIYSGRSEELVGPLIETFEDETGISVDVRWASTPELAATLLEEGQNSPADLFLAQDPGGLGAVDTLLSPLPDEILDRVPEAFQDQNGQWVGITGRVRVVVYNTDRLTPADLPQDMMGFTDPEWKGRIGWAPTNASFQSMVTAMRLVWGEEQTRDWLTGIVENEPIAYEKNTPTVAAVEAGEVDVGFVNHYYLYRFLAEEGESFTARNYFLPAGGPGSVILTSGAGILQSAENRLSALAFLEFLLDERAQQYFAEETFEYPLNPDVRPFADLVPVDDLQIPNLNLSDLAGTRKTVLLLQDVGALP